MKKVILGLFFVCLSIITAVFFSCPVNASDKDIFLDLMNDVYENAKICRQKYKNYNIGLISVCVSALLLMIDIIIFVIVR